VCQNLSVADSPARLAQQMRATIARDLEAGRTPDQIRGRFAAAYGDWILLAPPKRGIDLIAWLGPVLLVAGGVAVAALSIRRWTSGRTATVGRDAVATEVAPGLTAADQRLLARALEASVEERE
jgi:cytochrome c-type biogenesis protein CcmH